MSVVIQQTAPARRATRKAALVINAEPEVPERTPSALKAALARVADSLERAAGIEEDHAWSGDSDRILAIAAWDIERHGQEVETSTEARLYGLDAVALIKAARLVPGDVESPERTELLEQAARELCWIIGSESPHSELIDPGVSRLSPLITPSKAQPKNCPAAFAAMERIDFLAGSLAHSNSVLTVLVDMFSRSVPVKDPLRIAGTLKYLADSLAGAEDAVEQLPANMLPSAACTAISHARSLSELLHSLLNEEHFDCNYANGVYSDYFNAIAHAVRSAIQLMEARNHD
ncbi:hypothetical protein [Diaphorobacter ruginosibacter]|uniref:hypothetical protein n=1 Tax=Diaphorobacter ruginosibacter TaxID=1715720 RepID=UPI00334290ED